MKTREEVEQIKNEMISQIPELVDVISDKDEEESLVTLGSFIAKLGMVEYILDDKGTSFEDSYAATAYAVHKIIEKICKINRG